MQLQGKLMHQTLENKNLILDLIFACLTQIWIPIFFWRVLPLVLDIVPSYYPIQFIRKLMRQV